MRERSRGIAERELDEAEHPLVTRLRDPDPRGLRPCGGALRPGARLVDPTQVGGDDGEGKLVVWHHATELRANLQRAGRISLSLAPVARPPFEEPQLPERKRLGPRVVSGRERPPELKGERPCCVELDRPHELMTVDPGRPFPERSVRECPLECDGLVHLGARDAAAGPELPVTVDRKRAAPECDVVGSRGGAGGLLAVGEAALDPVTPLHEGGEPEVRRCLQGVVLFRLGERLVVQRFRIVGIRLHGGKLDEDRGALHTRRGLCSRAREQDDRAVGVARDVVTRGGEEETSSRAADVSLRGEPERVLRQLGGRGRRAASLGGPCRILESRGDLAVGLGRREREVPRPFFGGRNDRREPRVQRPALRGGLACCDRGAEQRMREPQVRTVALQDLRVERLGQRGLGPVAEHALDDVDGRLADRGHDARHLDR